MDELFRERRGEQNPPLNGHVVRREKLRWSINQEIQGVKELLNNNVTATQMHLKLKI